MFIEATVYSDYLKGWEQWVSLICFSSTQNFWSQKPPETVSEMEKLKIYLGMPPDPPSLRKSISSIIFLAI